MKKLALLIMVWVLLLSSSGCDRKEKTTFVTIGTGSITGVYYPTGGAIGRMVNAKLDKYKVRVTVESTAGSVYNINAVLRGDLELGVVQSDRQYQAVNGLFEWEGEGRQSDLRAVFSIHPESITLVAAQNSGIDSVSDLRGKRVNLGNQGSGQLQNSKDVIAAFGINEDEIEAQYAKAAEAPGLLQNGQIDAFFYTVGHPSVNIKEATSGKINVIILPIDGPEVDAMVVKFPYYALSLIPQKEYPEALNSDDIPSVGVKATLVTSKKLPQDVVYAITKEVFENFEAFKALHPAYQVLTVESMLSGLSAPIHQGALKYYREAGLIDLIDPSLIQE